MTGSDIRAMAKKEIYDERREYCEKKHIAAMKEAIQAVSTQARRLAMAQKHLSAIESVTSEEFCENHNSD